MQVLSRGSRRTGILLFSFGLVVTTPYFLWNPRASSASTITGGVTNCAVKLRFTPIARPTQVSATIKSGCTGGDYYLVSDVAQSNVFSDSKPQFVYEFTDQAPWTVQLPPCYWQADFVEAKRAPVAGQHLVVEHFVAGKIGGEACSTTTSSTATTVTTSTTTTIGVTTPTTTNLTTQTGAETTPTPASIVGSGYNLGSTAPGPEAHSAGRAVVLAFTGAAGVRLMLITGVALLVAGALLLVTGGRPPTRE